MGRPKKAVQSLPLAKNETVRELLTILEGNHMPGAKDLLAIMGQVGTMEKHLADMVTELSAMRRELAEAQRQNHPIRTALQKAVLLLQAQVGYAGYADRTQAGIHRRLSGGAGGIP